MEQPVWKPGGAVPAEPLGSGIATVETPRETPPPIPRTPTPVPPPRRPSVPRPPMRSGVLPERPPWLVPAAVAAVIVLLLGIFGIVILSHRGGPVTGQVHPTPSAHASGSPKGTPSSSPTGHALLAVPTYSPTSADQITKVIICSVATPCNINGQPSETATACEISACKVEVGIYFSAPQHSPVQYSLKFFDRCTGVTTDLPGPNPYTPPGYAIVIPSDHWAVNIPKDAKAGALVAVTQQPAIAYSAPLLLGGDSC